MCFYSLGSAANLGRYATKSSNFNVTPLKLNGSSVCLLLVFLFSPSSFNLQLDSLHPF